MLSCSQGDSTDLESYIAEGDGHTSPIRLPFGHEGLHYGLNMVLKSRKGRRGANTSVWILKNVVL